MRLPGFGLVEQKKLFQAKVLVVGAGGLGCPALLYLAAAGVGQLGIVDFDQVEISNLHRQILFNETDLGLLKADIAKQKLAANYPNTSFTSYACKLEASNAQEIMSAYDLVIDGSDNFTTRYLINDTCVALNKPMVYGSVSRYEGQVAVFNFPDEHKQIKNYRDLFPHPPKEGLIQNCAEAGVLGVLTGIIGCLQANEALKIITGLGNTLANKMLSYHSLHNVFYESNFGSNQGNVVGDALGENLLQTEVNNENNTLKDANENSLSLLNEEDQFSSDTSAELRDISIEEISPEKEEGAKKVLAVNNENNIVKNLNDKKLSLFNKENQPSTDAYVGMRNISNEEITLEKEDGIKKFLVHNGDKNLENAANEKLLVLRENLDEIDSHLTEILAQRNVLATKIAVQKIALNMALVQTEQYEKTLGKRLLQANELGLNAAYIEIIFNEIHKESIAVQKEYDNRK
ncbi:MAG: ThiF family adenylyltransferase [bacterium]|nr:ThiF family adenylyltransferase [bacterium]